MTRVIEVAGFFRKTRPTMSVVRAVSIDPLGAAALGAAVLALLLLMQYAHRRKPFILLWAAGWLLIAPTMLLVSRDYEPGNPRLGLTALGMSQLFGICTATLCLWSADRYRQTRYVRRGGCGSSSASARGSCSRRLVRHAAVLTFRGTSSPRLLLPPQRRCTRPCSSSAG